MKSPTISSMVVPVGGRFINQGNQMSSKMLRYWLRVAGLNLCGRCCRSFSSRYSAIEPLNSFAFAAITVAAVVRSLVFTLSSMSGLGCEVNECSGLLSGVKWSS